MLDMKRREFLALVGGGCSAASGQGEARVGAAADDAGNRVSSAAPRWPMLRLRIS
jgi:hypothetical protein